ncbi:geminin [Takifugu rubripes]|uniref:Geminin DNA replication inhibitor n=1 Tax=Takifugu rubripes TaxID=31033 RepID=A0A674P169_TAKRU|nr:geminin-like [Takifugu rubripes]
MSSSGKPKSGLQASNENIMSFFGPSQKAMGPSRQALQLLKDSAANKDPGRSTQAIPKRKQWSATPTRGPKRVKVEVKSTQTEESQCLVGGMSVEAYDLMVREAPSDNYWKELAEERRKALYDVLQENEKLHKDIEAKNEQITALKSENEELHELAKHVQYMANMIERLTGMGPDNLEELRDMALETEDTEQTGEASDQSDSEEEEEEEEEPSAPGQAGPSEEE